MFDVEQFFPAQLEAFDLSLTLSHHAPDKQRMCLYFKTGAGKTVTALGCLWYMGMTEAVVVTPPSTFAAWEEWAAKVNFKITCMSHAKFRDKKTQVSRRVPIIVDESHLLGGHTGKGWKKMDRLGMGLQAPLLILSATPNYNDAERVYCVQHVLDPVGTKGGYIEWLYRHCKTVYNPFKTEPDVEGFVNFASAADFLSSLPNVVYVPDDLQYKILEESLPWFDDHDLRVYGYDGLKHRIMASTIEEKHLKVWRNFAGSNNVLRPQVRDWLWNLLSIQGSPLLIFAAHSTVAELVYDWMQSEEFGVALITGKTSTKEKARLIAEFNAGRIKTLIGTASLATGTDGMDKVCHHLIILDDTDDDALRRQLIGRIMPRGKATKDTVPAHLKVVRRLNFT
jgi:hypothetical protein